jgi:hypothetical protein
MTDDLQGGGQSTCGGVQYGVSAKQGTGQKTGRILVDLSLMKA